MLVLLHVEGLIVVPAKSHAELETLKAVLVCATVGAVTHCRVTVRNELVVVGTEHRPCLISRLLQDDDHESAHQEGCVTLLGVVQASIVVDLIVLILLVVHELL